MLRADHSAGPPCVPAVGAILRCALAGRPRRVQVCLLPPSRSSLECCNLGAKAEYVPTLLVKRPFGCVCNAVGRILRRGFGGCPRLARVRLHPLSHGGPEHCIFCAEAAAFLLPEGCNIFAKAADFCFHLPQPKLRCGGCNVLPRGIELRVPADVLGAAPANDGAFVPSSLYFFEFLTPIPDTSPWNHRPLCVDDWIVVNAKESTPSNKD